PVDQRSGISASRPVVARATRRRGQTRTRQQGRAVSCPLINALSVRARLCPPRPAPEHVPLADDYSYLIVDDYAVCSALYGRARLGEITAEPHADAQSAPQGFERHQRPA